jgi:hypothetical protein
MPNFAGQDLGPFTFLTVDADPNELQFTTYPGLQGKSLKNLGARGYTTSVDGAIYAPDLFGIATIEQNFRVLKNNATVGTLIDSFGLPWSSVVMTVVVFREILYTGWPWGWIRDYHAEFTHLSQS